MHRQRTFMPGDPREPARDNARQRIERWNQHCNFFKRGSPSDLARNPIGCCFYLSINARVFLDLDRVIRSGAPRTVRIGEDDGRLEQVRSDQVTLGSGNPWARG
jgi:hypothetical protein